MLRQPALKLVIAGVFVSLSSTALALGDQWYLGIGGGVSQLQPNPNDSSIDLDEKNGSAGQLYLGMDIDSRSSGQLTLYSLGEATFDNGESAEYYAGDASLLYRFFDSRDYSRRGKIFGASIYGRFGFGFIERDADLSLSNDTPVYFGAGGGVETYLTHNLGLRFEALYHETDTSSATLSVVARFGGQPLRRARRPAAPPVELEQAPAAEEQQTVEETAVSTAPVQRPEATAFPAPETLPEVYTPPAQSDTQATEPAGQSIDLNTVIPQSVPAPDQEAVQPPVPDPALLPLPLPAPAPAPAPVAVPAPETGSDNEFDVEIMADTTETLTIPATAEPNADEVRPASETSVAPSPDSDNDGVPDNRDNCLQSASQYPVNEDGCPLFDGRRLDVVFIGQTAELTPGSYPALDQLARVMMEYPDMQLELAAHTDNLGTTQDQSNRTRQRLKTVGVYLVNQGISARRLVLRSFGGSRPAYSNDNALGRRENNRIEVFEKP